MQVTSRAVRAVIVVIGSLNLVGISAAAPVDFAKQIKPILQANCVDCHGPLEPQSGLRVDTGAGLIQGGNSGPAVLPGKGAESPLIHYLTGKGELVRMPLEGTPLTDREIDLIKRWIDEGAKIPANEVAAPTASKTKSTHWSFQPVVRREPPTVRETDWVRNPIDAFILARLEKAGIAHSPEADRATLIRRLSFDLLGLPPAIEELDAFLSDKRPDAYERLVDRMLQSPHYGERWGRHWLDLARYADSNGFTIDGPRNIWLYRDWVIEAHNRDLPFNQFAIEQIAGDMLQKPTSDQLVATGFHRNTLINQEGGTDKEQFRVESVVDRVNTTGAVFLGLTVGCAQCHTHKYDPISHREYYQLFAFLNGAEEPTLSVPNAQQLAKRQELQQALAAAELKLREFDGQAESRRVEFENKLAALPLETKWQSLDPDDYASSGGATLSEQDDRSILVSGNIPASDTYTVTLALPLRGVTAVRLEALTDDRLPKQGPGLAANGNFVLTNITIGRRTLGEPDTLHPIKLIAATAEHSQPRFPVEEAIDSDPDKSGWAINVSSGSLNVERHAVFVFDKPLADDDTRLTISLTHGHPNRYSLGRFRFSVTSSPMEVLMLPADIRAALAVAADQRTPEQRQALSVELRRQEPDRVPLQNAVNKLKAELTAFDKSIPTTMIVRELSRPRPTHVMIRGDFLRPGIKVEPNVPAVLPPLPGSVKHPTRLDLAQWLVSPQNPLTPRVTVNRIWQKYFGMGLVETENDFGTQGTPPSHPELLDWLASEFVERGWSMKAMHKLIVTSATYRQASHARPELAQIDPRNKLLARQSRVRLEAEAIRDVALAASGLLSPKIGGPGVFPPQPDGIYRFTQQDKAWKDSQGADRYRRGMYTYFWRSSPYPFLMTFDAPNGNVTCTRRVQSNTPLQALTLANDRAFVEIAQGLASRLLRDGPSDDQGRLEFAFRLCLARKPTDTERNTLMGFLASQRASFGQAFEEAAAAAPAKLPPQIDAPQAAAWTSLARVLMNLDEFITRE